MTLNDVVWAFLGHLGVLKAKLVVSGSERIVSEDFSFNEADIDAFFDLPDSDGMEKAVWAPRLRASLATHTLAYDPKTAKYSSVAGWIDGTSEIEPLDDTTYTSETIEFSAPNNQHGTVWVQKYQGVLNKVLGAMGGRRVYSSDNTTASVPDMGAGYVAVPRYNVSNAQQDGQEIWAFDAPFQLNVSTPSQTNIPDNDGDDTVTQANATTITFTYRGSTVRLANGITNISDWPSYDIPTDIRNILENSSQVPFQHVFQEFGVITGRLARPMYLKVSGGAAPTNSVQYVDGATSDGVTIDVSEVRVVDRTFTGPYVGKALANLQGDKHMLQLGWSIDNQEDRDKFAQIVEDLTNADFVARVITYSEQFVPKKLREWHSDWAELPNDYVLGGRLDRTVKQFDNKYAGQPTRYLVFVTTNPDVEHTVTAVDIGTAESPAWEYEDSQGGVIPVEDAIKLLDRGDYRLVVQNPSLWLELSGAPEGLEAHYKEVGESEYALDFFVDPIPVPDTNAFVEAFVGSRLQEDRDFVQLLLTLQQVHDRLEFGDSQPIIKPS